MGWGFAQGASKKDVIKELTQPQGYATGATGTTIAKRLVGNHLWVVVELVGGVHATPKRFLAVHLLGAEKGFGWGSKTVEEAMGPCETTCPVEFLDLVPDPGGFATAWRARVRAVAAARAKLNTIKVGDTVKLIQGCKVAGCPVTEAKVINVKPLRVSLPNGLLDFTVSPRLIAEVGPA